MNNAVLELIHRHASVRQYRPDPVPVEIVETVVGAAQRASTSSNLQMLSVIAVTDPIVRARLAAICANQEHVAQAPVFLAWCADLHRLDRVCQLRGYSQVTNYVENFLVAATDAAIAAQNTALAAESLGLGICYIGSIRNNTQAAIELLKLPHLVFPLFGMTLGWPAAQPYIRPRLPITAVLHWECYDEVPKDAELQAYDQAMIATGIYRGRQVSVSSKSGETEYGWLEHSARRVSQPHRTELREVLKRQGFALE